MKSDGKQASMKKQTLNAQRPTLNAEVAEVGPNSQTSPRPGGTFLLIQHRGQRVPSVSGNVIVERAGIPRWKMLNDFSHELLLFFDWQYLELGKQFCCGCAHAEY
jgi:hypothetical protein